MKISTSKSFDDLMKEALTSNQKHSDFKFNKMLSGNDSRKRPRKAAVGLAFMYDENLQLVGKTELTDASGSGIRVRTSGLNLEPGSKVTIIIVCAGNQFEQITCTIRWISDVDVTLKCRQMGVQFATITPKFKDTFFRYMEL